MTGIITINKTSYIFRDDTGFSGIFAWNIHAVVVCDRIQCHKWNKLPKGYIEVFDIDNPPETVRYIPILK